MIKTIYALVEDAEKADGFLGALRWTASAYQAHTTVHVLTPLPNFMPALAPLGGIYMPEVVLREEGEAELGHVHRLLKHTDTPFEVVGFQDDMAWLSGTVKRHQPLADIVMVGTAESWEIDRLRWRVVETIIGTAGCPVLLVPPGRSFSQVKYAVFGWRSSPEARRALHDLTSLASPGARIDVTAVSEAAGADEQTQCELNEVCAYLHRLGFNASSAHLQDGRVAEALQVCTMECGADLLAVGAFARSRMREILFGGVTHDLVRDARVPVLLSR